jgi:hypothetical protein
MNLIFLKTIWATVLISIAYGILHDMITANLCVEYFTIGHPKIIQSESPFLLALLWGVIATWWVALPMGLIIALSNELGRRTKLEFSVVLKLIVKLTFVMFGIAFLSGIMGYFLAESKIIYLIPKLADKIDISMHSKFLAAGWAHVSSYISGIIGTIVLSFLILRRRNRFSD